MANPDELPNPNIAQDGKETQFGQPGGADPAEAARKAKPWSARRQLKVLFGEEVEGETADVYKAKLKGPMTGARRLAIKMMAKAEEGSVADMERVIENVEGKLVQPTSEVPPPKKYNYDDMTDEEAAAAYDELCGKN